MSRSIVPALIRVNNGVSSRLGGTPKSKYTPKSSSHSVLIESASRVKSVDDWELNCEVCGAMGINKVY